MICDADYSTVMSVLKSIYNIGKFIIPFYLIVTITITIFKIVISKNDDDVKKHKKMIMNRVISCIMFFLIPSFVFMVLGMVLNSDMINIDLIRMCWHSV